MATGGKGRQGKEWAEMHVRVRHAAIHKLTHKRVCASKEHGQRCKMLRERERERFITEQATLPIGGTP